MTELARKLLDDLLGADRNKPLSQKGTGGVKFYDDNVPSRQDPTLNV